MKVAERLLQSIGCARVPEVSSFEIRLVRGGVAGAPANDAFAPFARQRGGECASDLLCDRVLHAEHVCPRHVEAVGPHGQTVCYAHKRDVDAKPVGRSLNRTIDDQLRAELAARADRVPVGTVPPAGAQRPHRDRPERAQFRDERFGKPEAEIVVFRRAAGERLERENRD
ncbi:MAG TPA: hypothetical protein VGA51_09805 [Casimicrobiaceae bacterium]